MRGSFTLLDELLEKARDLHQKNAVDITVTESRSGSRIRFLMQGVFQAYGHTHTWTDELCKVARDEPNHVIDEEVVRMMEENIELGSLRLFGYSSDPRLLSIPLHNAVLKLAWTDTYQIMDYDFPTSINGREVDKKLVENYERICARDRERRLFYASLNYPFT